MVPRRVPTSTPVSALLFRAITTDVSGLMTVEAENARSGPRDGERRSIHWRLSKTRRAVRRRRPQNPDLFQTTADRQLFPCQGHSKLPCVLRWQACNHLLHNHGIAVSVLLVAWQLQEPLQVGHIRIRRLVGLEPPRNKQSVGCWRRHGKCFDQLLPNGLSYLLVAVSQLAKNEECVPL